MRIVPGSTVNLYAGVDTDADLRPWFSSRANQRAYFTGKLIQAKTPCTYIHKSGRIRLTVAGNIISQCNYLSFINPDYDNIEYYCNIIDYDWVNNETVDILWAVDDFQTHMFDVEYADMYIDREHLSETLFTLAETNPYDLRIMEFRTSESLPISRDIEKPNYTLGGGANDDGYLIGDEVINTQGLTNPDVLGVLVKLSEIDFSDLDSNVQAGQIPPSTRFKAYLKEIENNQPMGYWSLPWSMYEYLHDHPSSDPNLNINQNSFVGTEWSINGVSVSPFTSTLYQNNCAVIYDADGCSSQGKLSVLLNMLIEFGCLSSIVSMYVVPKDIMLLAGVDSTNQEGIETEQKTAKTVNNVVNKKLDLFPYSYLRLMCPNGDIKELHYEDFIDVQNGGDNCKVKIMLDVGDQPTLMIAPYNYRISGMSRVAMNNANVEEAMYFKQFPTMPYNIDSYLAQVANASMGVIAGNTVEYGYSLAEKQLNIYKAEAEQAGRTADFAVGVTRQGLGGGFVDAVKDYFGGTSGGSSAGNLVRQAGDIMYQGAMLDINKARNTLEQNMSQQAYSNLVGNPNAIANNLKDTKPAFACNKYVPSNGVGATNFNILSYCDVIFMRVSLNPTILEKYDNYFSRYGYSSGRCGIPRAIKFMQGSSNNDEIPHWITVDGRPTTYVKTQDCKVTHARLPVALAIKNIFDAGVRLINCDPTTP